MNKESLRTYRKLLMSFLQLLTVMTAIVVLNYLFTWEASLLSAPDDTKNVAGALLMIMTSVMVPTLGAFAVLLMEEYKNVG